MSKTTRTETVEYDQQGNVAKRTIVTVTEDSAPALPPLPPAAPPVAPAWWQPLPLQPLVTCGGWVSIDSVPGVLTN